ALQIGLVVSNATALGAAVLLLRIAAVPWRVPRRNWKIRAATIALWAPPLIAWQFASGSPAATQLPLIVAFAAAMGMAIYASRLKARYRRGSQAFRLTMTTLG